MALVALVPRSRRRTIGVAGVIVLIVQSSDLERSLAVVLLDTVAAGIVGNSSISAPNFSGAWTLLLLLVRWSTAVLTAAGIRCLSRLIPVVVSTH